MGHDLDQEFDLFWSIYPRHIAKADARKAWKQTAKIRPTLDLLTSALEAQKKSAQWQSEQFIPYPATWLRGERWEDCLPCSTQGTDYDAIWSQACNAPTSKH